MKEEKGTSFIQHFSHSRSLMYTVHFATEDTQGPEKRRKLPEVTQLVGEIFTINAGSGQAEFEAPCILWST